MRTFPAPAVRDYVLVAVVCWLVVTLVPAGHVPAGAEVGENELARSLARADSLKSEKQYDEAETVLVRQLPNIVNPTDRAQLLTQLGRVRTLAWKLPAAETTLHEAVQFAEVAGDSLMLSAALYYLAMAVDDQGRPPRVVPIYERLVELAQKTEIAEIDHFGGRARLGLARRQLRSGEFAEARLQFESAIAVFRDQASEEWEYRAKYLLGILEARTANNDAARTLWNETLDWARRNDRDSLAGGCLNNLGRLEIYHGDPGRAVAYWREAYDLHTRAGQTRAAMTPGMNAAIALREAGRYDEAAELLTELLADAREHSFRDHETSALINLGEVARSFEHFPQAAQRYRQALALLAQSDDPEIELNALVGLSIALAEMDSLDAGIQVLEAASDDLRERIDIKSRCSLDWRLGDQLVRAGRSAQGLACLNRALATAEQTGLNRLPLEILPVAASAHRALGRPDSALVYMRQAVQAWESDRSLSRDPNWREIHGERGSKTCTELADLLLEYPPAVPYADRVREAFDTMQRFKARTLLERIVDPRGASPDSLLRIPEAVGLEELQRSIIRPGELLLESFVGPDHSFVFVVTQAEFRLIRLPGHESDFFRSVERYQRLLATIPDDASAISDRDIVTTASRSMGTSLLSEVEDLVAGCERILFVPDGPLHGISLGSLRLDTGASPGAPLLTQHQVVRIPSCALLSWQRRAEREAGGSPPDGSGAGRILALAERRGPGGLELVGTVDEVQSLGRKYRRVDVRVRGDNPGETVPLADLARYQVLHFAAHTVVDDQRPWHSGVCLGSEDTDVLRASRIATMQLGARLAVLSGCESGGGRVMSGEGVLGLSSAFICAGVPAVVATIWPVSDEVTAQLMDFFYQHVAAGETIASSLRAAQLDLLANESTSHPFFWAGYVLIGDGDMRVDLQRRASWARWGMSVVLVLATGLAVIWRRRARA